MKALKIFLPLLALGAMTTTPLLRAQDDKASAPGEHAEHGERGGRAKARGNGMMNADAMVTRLDEAVKLTAEQKTKAHDIYARMISEVQALPQEDRRTKGQEIRTATNKEIRALLTADQQKKFDEMAARGPGGNGPRGGRKKDN